MMIRPLTTPALRCSKCEAISTQKKQCMEDICEPFISFACACVRLLYLSSKQVLSLAHLAHLRVKAEMLLPLLSLSLFFHSREPTNLRPHSRGILSINRPSIKATCCFHIHYVCERGRENVFFKSLDANLEKKSFPSLILLSVCWFVCFYGFAAILFSLGYDFLSVFWKKCLLLLISSLFSAC